MDVPHETTTADWPRQGPLLREVVRVALPGEEVSTVGRVLRDDAVGDQVLLIQLADGRVVLGSECVFETYAPVGG